MAGLQVTIVPYLVEGLKHQPVQLLDRCVTHTEGGEDRDQLAVEVARHNPRVLDYLQGSVDKRTPLVSQPHPGPCASTCNSLGQLQAKKFLNGKTRQPRHFEIDPVLSILFPRMS